MTTLKTKPIETLRSQRWFGGKARNIARDSSSSTSHVTEHPPVTLELQVGAV